MTIVGRNWDEFMNVLGDPVTQHGFMGCAICGKPLRLAASKSENGGLPIHEECYLLRLKLKEATPLSSKGSVASVIPASLAS